MLQDYRVPFPLAPPYTGHASSISAQVVDTGGTVVQTITGFTERGSGTGDYGATARMDTALAGRIVFAWGGTPALEFIPPRLKLPTGLPPDTLYPYPLTFSPGPPFAGQASSVSAQVVDTSGTVLATITTFTEVSPGLYYAEPLVSSSWNGEIQYAWSGTPTIPVIRPVLLLPATAEGSSTTTLTATDLANIGAELTGRLIAQGLTTAQVSLLSYLRTLVRDGASGLAAVTGKTLPSVVPGNDYLVSTVYQALPAGTQLADATLQVRLKGNPVTGVPDRICTTAGQTTPGGLLSTLGGITDSGSTASDGTVTATVTFFVSATETGHLAGAVAYSYNVTAHDTLGQTHTLEIGNWSAVSGGPLG